MGEQEKLLRVLFVDDEELVRNAFARSMRSRGFEVDVAASGVEAVRLVQRRFYPVIATDLRMPGMDGLTLIKRLQPTHPSTAFVVVTALPDIDLGRDHAIDKVIVSIIAKPWDDEELASVLLRAFKLHDSRQTDDDGTKQNVKPAILLVEDNPGDAVLVSKYLNQASSKFEIYHVERLSAALESLHDRSFQLIIADLSLPDARGLDAVIRIHKAAPETAIIVLTGMDDESVALQAVQLGAQDYLIKGQVNGPTLHRSIRYSTERKRAEQRLSYLAHYDQLTGLANRITFQDRMIHALTRARRLGNQFAVLFLDLDKFKEINDTLGHEAGDTLLQEIGKRLQAAVREYDTVARLGGDEFAILVEEMDGHERPVQIAERVLALVSEPMVIEGNDVKVSSSIGVALYPDAGTGCEELLKAADRAMYNAKKIGNTFQVFSLQKGQKMMSRRRLTGAVMVALEQNRFSLHYQPQVRLSTHNIVGLEALLRWNQPDGSVMMPKQFVSVLDDTDLIINVGEWVLMTACQQLAKWQQMGPSDLRVAVNLSARQFEQEGLVEAVSEALQLSEVTPSCLELEITESLLMRDTQRTNRTLSQLKELGVRIAIDDFGTGYSSLAYLHRFSVDTIKIDRSFIESLGEGKEGASIASAIVGLGHKLNLEVIAEGVETREQLNWLYREGCDIAQGFFLGRPSPTWNRLQKIQIPAIDAAQGS